MTWLHRLGADVAERDQTMLTRAFYDHVVLRELKAMTDGYRIVVGRRGAGKSAIRFHLRQQPETVGFEHDDFQFHALVRLLKDELGVTTYPNARMIARVAWKQEILQAIGRFGSTHFKVRASEHAAEFAKLLQTSAEEAGLGGVLLRLRRVVASDAKVTEFDAAEALSRACPERPVLTRVQAMLDLMQKPLLLTFDGLDEGWINDPVATGVVGGLVLAAADVCERLSTTRIVIFLRDSMLRSLFSCDADYARNAESNTLRLEWTRESLLKLIGGRLKVVMNTTDGAPMRLWNSFVGHDLQDTTGFDKCLQRTLWRPRDLIQLLNDASRNAAAHERDRVTEVDLIHADRKWSETRLADLVNEYSDVFPGLREFIQAMKGIEEVVSYSLVCERLNAVVERNIDATQESVGMFGSGQGAFDALFSIGFLGLVENGQARFCYDGSERRVADASPSARALIHPCYWSALGVVRTGEAESLQIDDGFDVTALEASKQRVISDVRVRMLGRRAEELEEIPQGAAAAPRLANWLMSATRILLSPLLNTIELRRVQGSDLPRVVGDIRANSGLFHRIHREHAASQLVIFPLNEAEVDREFLTRVAQTSGAHRGGSFCVVVRRSISEEPSEAERKTVRWAAREHKLHCLVLPARLIQRSLRKFSGQRGSSRDWIMERLDRAFGRHSRGYWHSQKS